MSDLRDTLQATLTGSYTLERELGGGGMSRVFLADELRLGRKVVVKVLSPELAAGISAERFEREIKLAASLQQANIVPVLSAGDTNGLPFYTMPFVEGQSLRARLAVMPRLSVTEILRILGDVARALQYAHDRGIVHRDIKPDNVLLSGGTAVVTDFGIAKALSASRTKGDAATLTQMGTSIGTPAYMSPEQAAGDPDIDHRADIYAFGCMAYELLAGHPPFHGKSPHRVLAAHMAEAPAPIAEKVPDVPSGLSELVMRCLAKDPGERPGSAADLVHTLNTVTSGSGMAALPPVHLNNAATFRKALIAWAVATAGVWIVAKAATISIGLPSWTVLGSMIVMGLGLPVILFTGFVHYATRRAITSTPAVTPGGTTQAQGTMATIALKASPHLSWKRTARGGVLAVSAFAVLIVAFMVLRALGVGPGGSLLAAGKLNVRDPLLIADFTGPDSNVTGIAAEGVRAHLSQSTKITLVTPAAIANALRRMQRPATARIDPALAQSIALREGIKAVVNGEVRTLGAGYAITLRLVSADSGATLASYTSTADSPSELIAAIDEVSRKLREKIGESLKAVQGSPPLQKVTTASLEALRAYSDGARAFDVERDFQKAIPLLRQAVALDTGFATAWRKLGTALSNARYPQSAVDSAVSNAYRMRERLTESERHLAEAYYFMRGAGRDRAKAEPPYLAMLRRGDSSYALNNLAVLYMSRREFARAESLYRTSIRRFPENAIPIPNLVGALLVQGKVAAAESVITAARPRLPDDPTLTASMLRVRFLRTGDIDAFAKDWDSVVAVAKTPQLRIFGHYSLGNLALIRGQISESERRWAVAESLEALTGIKTPPILDSMSVALHDSWFRGERERAVRRLDASLAALPLASMAESDRPYAEIAAGYAIAGRPDRARAILTQLQTQTKDTALLRSLQPGVHTALGEIALAENRPRDAVAEFRRGDVLPDGPVSGDILALPFNLGRAFDLANEPDSAIAMLEKYVSLLPLAPIREASSTLGRAGAYKRLGELYEAKRDYERAVSNYTTFVDLWKNADPELRPRVDEVRKKLERLAGENATRVKK
jgi:tetratricopeptide (TPR) repeat protein/tRNA A-37 threonylcarbamoyl transferase component Bud32